MAIGSAEKHCIGCGRRFAPRKRWRGNWNAVRFCSVNCRRRGVNGIDKRLEHAILELLARRADGATLCPSEAARSVSASGNWRTLMEPARRAARRLVHAGRVEILQKGRVVDPSDFKGPVRIREVRRDRPVDCRAARNSDSHASGEARNPGLRLRSSRGGSAQPAVIV